MAKKRIVFIGGGAVGAYVAAHLVRGGEDVTVFDPWPENVAAINAKGIEVTGTTEPVSYTHLTLPTICSV